MTRGGYLETAGSRRPLGFALVIAAHVAVLAAVMLARGEIIRIPDTVMIGEQIPLDKAPPPVPEKRIRPDAKTRPTKQDPVFVDIKPIDPAVKITDLPVLKLDTGTPIDAGAGDRTKAAAPVLVDARIDPRFAGDFQPDYPSAAQRDGLSGKATVRVRIGTDGRVRSVELVRADDPSFYEATARQAMRRWRFAPATRDGVAVESVKVLTVSFVLRD